MLRLTRTMNAANQPLLRLDGRLAAGDLDELRRAIAPHERPVIELAGLVAADGDAIRALRALRDRGCRLTGGSLYINSLLEER